MEDVMAEDHVNSITPQGQALNQDISTEDRVRAVPKARGEQGEAWEGDAGRRRDPDHDGGFGTLESTHPSDFPHKGGDPVLDGDAQYGASPLRSSRYDEDHKVNDKHVRDGKASVQPALHKGPAPDTDR
jgi:hypothetical protein